MHRLARRAQEGQREYLRVRVQGMREEFFFCAIHMLSLNLPEKHLEVCLPICK
jgi:hypothetical protein